MNPMREIRIEKVTLNVGAGKEQSKLEKGVALLKYITESNPVKTVTSKRIQEWALRPGLPIGCKVTLRKEKAEKLLSQLLGAKENRLRVRQFDENGNISFGIHEYIDIPGIKYNSKIGISGFEVSVTLERAGYRIKRRRFQRRKVAINHKVTKDDAVEFMKKKYNVEIEGEE
tara:strand:- start:12087 stop:12602 length:516 start_codon:yes stop_codon:yes gene_type:complete